MGEHLLTLSFSKDEEQMIAAAVRSLRDKLIIEFSDATPAQSEKLLATIFGEGMLAG